MDRTSFYKKAADYWSNIPPTLEGVLGGFGFISKIDIDCSKIFLDDLFTLETPPSKNLAIDCGAGIGRITQDLLINVFNKVDMIEQNAIFLEQAEKSIEPKCKLGQLYPIGLQDFTPAKKYDVIWCQWVLGHLTDKDFVKFFTMCKNALAENGVIIVKENVTSSGNLERDDVDSSVTRSLKHLLSLFKKSNLKILKEHRQSNFPRGIYPVYIFALRSSDILVKSDQKENEKNHSIFKSDQNIEKSNGKIEKSNEKIEKSDDSLNIKYEKMLTEFQNIDVTSSHKPQEIFSGISKQNETTESEKPNS